MMTPYKFIIFDFCSHNTSDHLSRILRSNYDCNIFLNKKEELTDIDLEQIDLCYVVNDVSHADNILKNRDVIVPKIGILCKQGNDNVFKNISDSHVDDFIITPLMKDEVLWRTNRLLGITRIKEKEIAKKNILQKAGISQLIGSHPTFLEKISIIPQVAMTNATVLMLGETGVGKEMCARAIHYLSERSNQPFIPVDCGTIPVNIMESELFGHKKGAFTDAQSNQMGIVSEAKGGTLFLDEIDTLTLAAQSKLLRLLQDKTYRIIGNSKSTAADIRIIAATNVDLQRRIKEKKFRKDLFYRFTITMELPSLRERATDIPLLANYLLNKYTREIKGKQRLLSPGALQKLIQYDWPGNIRELENIIQQAIVLSTNYVIQPENINIPEPKHKVGFKQLSFQEAKRLAIERFEKKYITDLLIYYNGNITHAAKEAQKDRSDFSKMVKKHHLDISSFSRNN